MVIGESRSTRSADLSIIRQDVRGRIACGVILSVTSYYCLMYFAKNRKKKKKKNKEKKEKMKKENK